MDIVVCVKRVPDTSEADVKIDDSGKNIDSEDLTFDINEWDNYAIEEAILIKEKVGGTVTAITIGPEESNEVLRRCMAKGADTAIRLTDDAFEGSDGYAIAKILHSVIKDMKFDAVFLGAQAGDDGYGMVGPMLAEMLDLPHATLVTKVDLEDGKAKVHRELEGGLEEVVGINLPAVLGIQTGINEPRYVSIMGIRKVAKKEIPVKTLADTGLSADDVGEAGSKTKIESMYIPEVGKVAEIIEGSPDEAAGKLAQILKDKGLLG